MDAPVASHGVRNMNLSRLEKKIKQFSSPEKLLRSTREAMAREALALSKKGFSTSTAPDGSRWRALKTRSGRPLFDTGALSNFSYSLTSNGFVLYAGAPYFVHHQYGAPRAKLPARPMVPTSENWGTWSAPMKIAAEKSIARWGK